MKTFWMAAAMAAVTTAVVCGTASAQGGQPLLIPMAPVARDVPGAKEMPDPTLTYKVVFVVGQAAPKVTDMNPNLLNVARYVNTLAAHGIPADQRKIAVVLHLEAAEVIQNNEAFRARHEGHDNPNIALIETMARAGVEFHVCGQAVLGRKIDPKAIVPQVQLDLWAATTVTNLQLRGYIRAGG